MGPLRTLLFILKLPLFAGAPAHFPPAWEIQSQAFHYVDEPHPRLMILFSGTPGMGKTTVARYLEENLHGIRFSNDEARQALKNVLGIHDIDSPLREYIRYALSRIDSEYTNHLVIYDCSIDRRFKEIYFLADLLGYETFTIRLDLKEDELIRRLQHREKNSQELDHFMKELPNLLKNYHAFDLSQVDFFLDMDEAIDENLLIRIQEKLQDRVLETIQ